MLKIGLTGGIGSGKSIVARVFGVLGVPVFEADAEGRRLLDAQGPVREAVVARFGADLYASGALDRKALGEVVFKDPAALADLNAIAHPAVRAAFRQWAEEQEAVYVLMEAAILAESGGHKAFDRIVLVTAPEDLRLRRVMRRDGTTEEAVRARMRQQGTDADRERIAHHIIVNDDQQLVIPQVLATHEALSHAATGGA